MSSLSSSLSATPLPLSLSLSLSLARAFAGRKARYAEIVRSERRPPYERLPPRDVPSDSVANSPLVLRYCPLPPSLRPHRRLLLLLLLYHHQLLLLLLLLFLLLRRRRFSTRRSRSREFDARRKQHGHGYGGPTIHSGEGRGLSLSQSYRTQSRDKWHMLYTHTHTHTYNTCICLFIVARCSLYSARTRALASIYHRLSPSLSVRHFVTTHCCRFGRRCMLSARIGRPVQSR